MKKWAGRFNVITPLFKRGSTDLDISIDYMGIVNRYNYSHRLILRNISTIYFY